MKLKLVIGGIVLVALGWAVGVRAQGSVWFLSNPTPAAWGVLDYGPSWHYREMVVIDAAKGAVILVYEAVDPVTQRPTGPVAFAYRRDTNPFAEVDPVR